MAALGRGSTLFLYSSSLVVLVSQSNDLGDRRGEKQFFTFFIISSRHSLPPGPGPSAELHLESEPQPHLVLESEPQAQPHLESEPQPHSISVSTPLRSVSNPLRDLEEICSSGYSCWCSSQPDLRFAATNFPISIPDTTCSICWQRIPCLWSFSETGRFRMDCWTNSRCGHSVHASCGLKWKDTPDLGETCPECRGPWDATMPRAYLEQSVCDESPGPEEEEDRHGGRHNNISCSVNKRLESLGACLLDSQRSDEYESEIQYLRRLRVSLCEKCCERDAAYVEQEFCEPRYEIIIIPCTCFSSLQWIEERARV